MRLFRKKSESGLKNQFANSINPPVRRKMSISADLRLKPASDSAKAAFKKLFCNCRKSKELIVPGFETLPGQFQIGFGRRFVLPGNVQQIDTDVVQIVSRSHVFLQN